jgi:AbrB family looped-hinge helix DNA binding protein
MEARSAGRWISTVRLGPKSQIVIPKEVRELFGLGPGDTLLLLADVERGIALVDPAKYAEVMTAVLGTPPNENGLEP